MTQCNTYFEPSHLPTPPPPPFHKRGGSTFSQLLENGGVEGLKIFARKGRRSLSRNMGVVILH